MTEVIKMRSPSVGHGKDPNDTRDDPKYRHYLEREVVGANDRGTRGAMAFRSLSEIRKNLKAPQYLVKPYIEKDTAGILFGESGAYKSFVVLDMGLCVAHGIDYHGRKAHQGPVFYICGEGHGGIGRRVEAWHIANGIDGDAPFYVSEVPANILEAGNAEAVRKEIDRLCGKHQTTPAMVIIDTLSTNMGDGDESSNGDVAKFFVEINNEIRKPFSAAVIIVHHVGHGAKDRERGAYALRGNTDFRIVIKPEIGYRCSMHCLKMKDGPEFESVAFQASTVTIPGLYDSEGEPVTSLSVTMTEYVPEEDIKKLSGQKGQALAHLQELYREYGERLEKQNRNAGDARVLTTDWQDKLQACAVIPENRNARYKIKKALLDEGVIREEGKFIHLATIGGTENE